jgi:formiminotetrahydrofolate cyclodeaminase
MSFQHLTLSSFLDALTSAAPTPGGGTAAAIAGAMGASLLMMVSGLPRTRTNDDAERAALAGLRESLTSLRDELSRLADADSEAFDGVMAAYRLAKTTDTERASRRAAIQQALIAASDVPMRTLRAVRKIASTARTVAAHGNRSAVSDVRVALELLEAAAAGAAANVDVNLTSLDDQEYRTTAAKHLLELTNQLTEDVAAARVALG